MPTSMPIRLQLFYSSLCTNWLGGTDLSGFSCMIYNLARPLYALNGITIATCLYVFWGCNMVMSVVDLFPGTHTDVLYLQSIRISMALLGFLFWKLHID